MPDSVISKKKPKKGNDIHVGIDNNTKNFIPVKKPRTPAKITTMAKAEKILFPAHGTVKVTKTLLQQREKPKMHFATIGNPKGLDPELYWIPKPYGTPGNIVVSHLWWKPK